ncbi:hypothetical protein N7481_012225 [Penicillium waksmanii]|uniref:uncharacterized protein n=1 Tax=Penicillium waksmanii TaxID=69791 RepID=UPI00254985DE|nr:uncharacterized protein N7481_012225 [Penicillium waksmanii]KAJ5965511.1 hypothetical protein N7481_012225 [Penicillium waksmanii]
MQMKTILTALAIASVAAASPVEDLETRAPTTFSCSGKAYCCVTSLNFPILFWSGLGQDCKAASMIPRTE